MDNKAYVSQTYPCLTVYNEENFRGSRRVFKGNLGIRNTDNILDGIESLRFFSTSSNATLVLLLARSLEVTSVCIEAIAALPTWMI